MKPTPTKTGITVGKRTQRTRHIITHSPQHITTQNVGYTSTVARQSFLADFRFDLNDNIDIEEFKNGYLRKESRSKALTATLEKKEKRLTAEFDSLKETG